MPNRQLTKDELETLAYPLFKQALRSFAVDTCCLKRHFVVWTEGLNHPCVEPEDVVY
jgi:hypothetical protein